MKKLWILCLFVTYLSLFLINETFKGQVTITPSNTFDSSATTAIFNNEPVALPNQIANETPLKRVLGIASGEKRIYVDLTNQRLYAYQGDTLVYSFLVSTGKWHPTPTGTFNISLKFRYIKMSGGSVALHTYYYLPNVPYVMFFQNDQYPTYLGYSIHGTYWHNNFGHPMSHGCINMKTEEAALIYEWSGPQLNGKTSARAGKNNPGTLIIIYGKAPSS